MSRKSFPSPSIVTVTTTVTDIELTPSKRFARVFIAPVRFDKNNPLCRVNMPFAELVRKGVRVGDTVELTLSGKKFFPKIERVFLEKRVCSLENFRKIAELEQKLQFAQETEGVLRRTVSAQEMTLRETSRVQELLLARLGLSRDNALEQEVTAYVLQ